MISDSEYSDFHVYGCGRLRVAPCGGPDGAVAIITAEPGSDDATEGDQLGWVISREEAIELISDLSAVIRCADLENTGA